MDYEFDWESHKHSLDRIFFGRGNVIEKGSPDHHAFWSFLQRYVMFKKKKSKEKGYKNTYDPLDKINMNIKWKMDFSKSYSKELSEKKLDQFQNIIMHFVDFLQKQKFSKLQKIKRDQEGLPIFAYKQNIIDILHDNQVVVIAGDTGCGKSTQVPQYLLHAGFKNIACTQPRRIACVSLSKRVSYETLNEYGSEVAYQVRFDKNRTKRTKILFLTEGLLLRQVSSDGLLSQYEVIVVDEVHERHIYTDFLLGVLKCILKQRSDLKLVLMSATINLELFSKYFDESPVICVPGRLYPIDLQYMPLNIHEIGGKTEKLDPSQYLRVLQLIDHKYPSNERGDVLMFLSGMVEIMTIVEAAKHYASVNKKWIILPLHSALSITEQDKVFDFPPEGVRKCIISTNIAETSVTIDGVRFVVDSGKVKEMSFDSKYKMQKLQEFWISKASSEQRKGRAGRTGPGVCFRLYSKDDYESFQDYSTPEIHRVPLDLLVLQMTSLGLSGAGKFPFIEPPDPVAIESSISYLKEQGALDGLEELTTIGKLLAQLPVDVVIGKILIMASLFDMVDPVLTICAALNVQTPFTMKGLRDYDAMTERKKVQSPHGDPITLLNLFDEWIDVKSARKDTRRWCKKLSLEEQRLYEMTKLKRQFKELLQEHGLLDKPEESAVEKTREERKQLSKNRKDLEALKHEYRTKGSKRKILKLDDDDWELEKEETSDQEYKDNPDELNYSIKDLEFRVNQDLTKAQNKNNQAHSFNMKEMNVLKIILSSGLYPQVAVPDEFNNYKPDKEQIFHTKNKGFVLLHPTSVFATDPDILQPSVTRDNSSESLKARLKGHVSNDHQLLIYVSLLETNKPYLTGVLRVPALQALLLFSSEIDTSNDCLRLIFDCWLEVCLQETHEEAENLLSNVVVLRHCWKMLLELKLKTKEIPQSEIESSKMKQSLDKLQKFISQKLAEFLSTDISYTLRRVLPAESASMYTGSIADSGENQTDSGCSVNPIKGGYQVNSYLVIGCVAEQDVSSLGEYDCIEVKQWMCKNCNHDFMISLSGRLQHEEECCWNHTENSVYTCKVGEQGKNQVTTKEYFCSYCKKSLSLSTKDILKHKKVCSSGNSLT